MAEERQNNATVNPPNFDRLAEGLRMTADEFARLPGYTDNLRTLQAPIQGEFRTLTQTNGRPIRRSYETTRPHGRKG